MKIHYPAFLLLLNIVLACSPASDAGNKSDTAPAVNEEAETVAIMAVIEKETDCFFRADLECWSQQWVHEPYVMQAWNNDDGTYSATIGWDSIQAHAKAWFATYYADGDSIIHPFVKREKPVVKFLNPQTAILTYKQYNADAQKKFFKASQESRLLEKREDGWKIIHMTAFWDSKNAIPVEQIQ